MVVQERLKQEPLPQISTAVESLGFKQTEDAPIETLYKTVGSRQKNRHRRFDDDLLLCRNARGLHPLKCVKSVIEAGTILRPPNDVFTPATTQQQGYSSHRADCNFSKCGKNGKGDTRADVKDNLHDKPADLTAGVTPKLSTLRPMIPLPMNSAYLIDSLQASRIRHLGSGCLNLTNGMCVPYVNRLALQHTELGLKLQSKSLIALPRSFTKRYPDVHVKAVMQHNTEHHGQISFGPHCRNGDFDEGVRHKHEALMHDENY